MQQRLQHDARQVVRMDMARVHVVLGAQRRRALLQALERQAVLRIDAGHAQDRQPGAGGHGPGAQHPFGIDAAQRARIARRRRALLANQRTAAVAVDAAGADVDHAPDLAQRRHQAARAQVLRPLLLRRREMQHPGCQAAQARQGVRAVEIGHHRHGAGGAQGGAALRLAGEGEHAEAAVQQRQQAHADVAATDDEQAGTVEGGGSGHGSGQG